MAFYNLGMLNSYVVYGLISESFLADFHVDVSSLQLKPVGWWSVFFSKLGNLQNTTIVGFFLQIPQRFSENFLGKQWQQWLCVQCFPSQMWRYFRDHGDHGAGIGSWMQRLCPNLMHPAGWTRTCGQLVELLLKPSPLFPQTTQNFIAPSMGNSLGRLFVFLGFILNNGQLGPPSFHLSSVQTKGPWLVGIDIGDYDHTTQLYWDCKLAIIPSKIEWDLTNGPRSVSCDRAIRYSGLGVRSVGPVGDFLE